MSKSNKKLEKSVSFSDRPPSVIFYKAPERMREDSDLGMAVSERLPVDSLAPEDRNHYVYAAMILFGVGSLVPWNMFITAKDYFVNTKLANAPGYANNFHTFVGIASQIPNVAFNWLNIFVRIRGGLTPRIVVSLLVIISMFLVSMIFSIVDTSTYTIIFFWATMVSLVIMQSSCAIYMNSVYGIAARLPVKYPGGIVLGSNLCGTIVVVLDWATDYLGDNAEAALIYFLCGMLVILICLVVFICLPLNSFYDYFNSPLLEGDVSSLTNFEVRVPHFIVMYQCRQQLFNIFINYFVTLSVFPNIHSDVKSVSPDNNLLGGEFTRVTCFLTFNMFALVGSITATIFYCPAPHYLKYFTIARLLFIPTFLFCNYHPSGAERNLPVIINNDYIYWTLAMIFSWSSGHGCTLGVIYVRSENVRRSHSVLAGMYAAAIIVTGILTGILFSGLIRRLV